jgi:hypothetical protein
MEDEHEKNKTDSKINNPEETDKDVGVIKE